MGRDWRFWAAAALMVGGLAWIAKVTAIVATDGSPEPAESILFLTGLVALVGGVVFAAAALARRIGPARAVAGSLVVLVLGFGLIIVIQSLAGDGSLLAEESGVLATGILGLLVGAVLWARRQSAVGARSAL